MRALVVGAVGVALVGTGCRASMAPWAPAAQCRAVDDEVPRMASLPEPPPHPDFANLRAFRSVFALRRVGGHAHHFSVYFHCVEPSVRDYAVFDDGRVEPTQGSVGPVRPPARDDVPAPQRPRAEQARRALEEAFEGEQAVRVVYQGTYRELVVEEVLPLSPPGAPFARVAVRREATLRANADLTALEGRAGVQGEAAWLCGRGRVAFDCAAPHWVDFEVESVSGKPLLQALVERPSSAFEQALLRAARQAEAGAAGVPLAALQRQQAEGLLPPELEQKVAVVFDLFARPRAGQAQESASLGVALSLRDAVFGVAEGRGEVTLAGEAFTAEVQLSTLHLPPRAHRGEVQLEFELAYTLRDGSKEARSAALPVVGTVVVDEGNAGAVELRLSGKPAQVVHAPPRRVQFPARGRFASIDAYVDVRRW